jgi:hypothetical protein
MNTNRSGGDCSFAAIAHVVYVVAVATIVAECNVAGVGESVCYSLRDVIGLPNRSSATTPHSLTNVLSLPTLKPCIKIVNLGEFLRFLSPTPTNTFAGLVDIGSFVGFGKEFTFATFYTGIQSLQTISCRNL